MIKSTALALASTLLLTSCGWNTRPEICEPAPARLPLNLADPAPLKPYTPNWVVITPSNADAVWKKMRTNGNDVVLFGLTDGDYEQLSVDFAEVRNFIIQQRRITQKYRDYYEPANTNK